MKKAETGWFFAETGWIVAHIAENIWNSAETGWLFAEIGWIVPYIVEKMWITAENGLNITGNCRTSAEKDWNVVRAADICWTNICNEIQITKQQLAFREI